MISGAGELPSRGKKDEKVGKAKISRQRYWQMEEDNSEIIRRSKPEGIKKVINASWKT